MVNISTVHEVNVVQPRPESIRFTVSLKDWKNLMWGPAGPFSQGTRSSCPARACDTWSPSRTWRTGKDLEKVFWSFVVFSLHLQLLCGTSSTSAVACRPSTNKLLPAYSSGDAPTRGTWPAGPGGFLPAQLEPPAREESRQNDFLAGWHWHDLRWIANLLIDVSRITLFLLGFLV